MNIYQVLLKPTITEKSTLLQESGRYTFQIAPTANKVQVKEAVEKNFNVTVLRQHYQATRQTEAVRISGQEKARY